MAVLKVMSQRYLSKIDLNFKFLSVDEESAEAVANVTAASMKPVNHERANVVFRKTNQP